MSRQIDALRRQIQKQAKALRDLEALEQVVSPKRRAGVLEAASMIFRSKLKLETQLRALERNLPTNEVYDASQIQ